MGGKLHRFGGSVKARMARDLIRHEDPEAVIALVDIVLPAVVEALPKDQLKIFVEGLFEKHLETLLRNLSRAERAALLRQVLPAIEREFPLADVGLKRE